MLTPDAISYYEGMESIDWSRDDLSGDNGILSLILLQDVSSVSYIPNKKLTEKKVD